MLKLSVDSLGSWEQVRIEQSSVLSDTVSQIFA